MIKTAASVAAALTAVWPLPALAQRGYYPGGWPGQMMGFSYGWGGGVFMIIVWILVIIALVAGIRWLFKSTPGRSGEKGASDDRALDILKERYARGEIDREQYLAMRADLNG